MFRQEFHDALEREQSSSNTLQMFQVDDLMEKLKLLQYERLLLKEMKMKMPGRYYFIKSFNPGEQFFMFTAICAWLIRKTGRNFEQPQEFDDPSITISKIIKILQEMDIPADFPSNKLIQGAGPICVFVLDCLATQALKISNTQILKSEAPQEEETSVEILENDSEIILEKVEEEQNAIASDDSDNDTNSLLDLQIGNGSARHNNNQNSNIDDYKMDTLADSENWRLELERVLPQLKVVVRTDPRDWRAHLEQMKTFKGNIESASEETHSQLKKLQTDISFVMEKIDSREKHLNDDLKNLIQQYKTISQEVAQINTQIKENDQEKIDLEQELSKVTDELENVKMQMEQRGNSMTDGSPLINIKKAIVKIKEEISNMDIKIGVMDHTINNEIVKRSIQFAELDPLIAA